MSAVFAIGTVVAHQGGWDEALLVATPILIIIGLLWLAKRRVDAAHATSHRAGPDVTEPDVTEPDDHHVGPGST